MRHTEGCGLYVAGLFQYCWVACFDTYLTLFTQHPSPSAIRGIATGRLSVLQRLKMHHFYGKVNRGGCDLWRQSVSQWVHYGRFSVVLPTWFGKPLPNFMPTTFQAWNVPCGVCVCLSHHISNASWESLNATTCIGVGTLQVISNWVP